MKIAATLMFLFFISLTFVIAANGQGRSARERHKMPETVDADLLFASLLPDSNKEQKNTYRVLVCADVPRNEYPLQPAYRRETGHVFCILQVIQEEVDTFSAVFGFYPKLGLPTLAFRRTKSVLRDNSGREYDVEISRELTKAQFDSTIAVAKAAAMPRYHLNKYNCYDYAIAVFNAAYLPEPLPLVYTKFPFPFGRGGSPCSVYQDLMRIKKEGGKLAPGIRFGQFRAPVANLAKGGEAQQSITN